MARITELRNDISSTLDKLDFLPRHKLESLITQENVEEILRDAQSEKQKADAWSAAEIHKLAEFVIEGADKIFAILLMIDKPRLIKKFFDNRFENAVLPISVVTKEPLQVQSSNMHMSIPEDMLKNTFSLSVWEKYQIYDFIQRQWNFLSPILKQSKPESKSDSKSEFEIEYDSNIILPWTPCNSSPMYSSGGYAQVEKRAVPESHFELSWGQPPPLDPSKNQLNDSNQTSNQTNEPIENQYLVAVKKLTGNRRDINGKKEADALKILRTLESKHVIKAILYFKQPAKYGPEVNHCFVFPWADKGNLWSFWIVGFKPQRPKLEIDFLVWAFGQLFGLMDAIQMMHDETLRHGDLKPENILCFPDSSQPGSIPVRLVITDVGLSKAHEKSTSQRKVEVRDVTSTAVSTTRYQPPELTMQRDEERVLSRAFDVWSAGCIFTEFLIWMLYGRKELLAFTDKSGPSEYWEDDAEGAKVRKVVDEKLHDMTKDQNCINDPALVQLVDLVKNNFLVIDVWTLADKKDQNISSQLDLTGSKSSTSTKQKKSKSSVSKKFKERIARVFTKKENGSGSNTTEERVSSSASTSRYRDTSEHAAARIRTINDEILGRTKRVDSGL